VTLLDSICAEKSNRNARQKRMPLWISPAAAKNAVKTKMDDKKPGILDGHHGREKGT
jgi:hypothetical protein